MNDAFAEILETAERAAAGSEADKSALAQLLVGTDLAGLGGPENRAYLAVLLDSIGMSVQAMLALGPGGSEHGDQSAGMPNLAGMLASGHGEYERANELFVQALSGAGDDTDLQTKILANLAALSLLAGKAEQASGWLARARGARGRAVDPATDVLLASTGFGIARAQGDLAGLREAVFRLNEATRARIAELGSDHPLALTAVASLAAAEFELASAEKSVESQERAIAVLEVAAHRLAADLGADHPQALTCLENLFVADFSLARANRSPDRAFRAASTLESISQRTNAALGEDHPQARAAAANAASARLELEQARHPMTRAPGDQPNFFTILGLLPDRPWDKTAYARALNEKRNLWSQQRQGSKTQDATGEGPRNLEYLSAIERVMRDPQAREAERLAALRQDGHELRQGRTVVGDRPSGVSRTRTLPALPGMSSDSVTQSLCYAVHLDPFLRDYVIQTVVEPHLRAVCPAYGVDLVAVARHAMKAQLRWRIHRYVLLAIRLALVSAVALAVLADWTAALAIACAGLSAAWFNLFWVVRADRLAALRTVTDNTPLVDQADPLSQEQEERLRKLDKANVIVYAQGEGDPFIGSGRRLHWYQLTPIDVTRPGHDSAGNVKVIRPFDAVTLHQYLATEVPKVGFSGLHVRNRLYVRGDHASDVAGLLPDQFAEPTPLVRSDWVKSGVNHPTEWARTYICMERIMSGGDLVVSMYVRAWLEHDMLSVERVIYFLPPLRRVYRPTREFAASTALSVTINAMGTAARQVIHILGGKWIGRLQTSEFGKNARRAETQARRQIKAGVMPDYGAKTSVREAVAAYDATEHFEEADILDSAKRLNLRIMDCIEAFLDDHGVDTSDFHDQVQPITTSINNIDTINAVIGGQGHVITGHGAVNTGSMPASA